MARFALLTSLAFAEAWQSSALSLVQRRAEQIPKCVVWHSQHKSAGMNIELMLSHRPLKGSGIDLKEWQDCTDCAFVCDRETWDCEKQTCTEQRETWNHQTLVGYDSKKHTKLRIAYRGYTPRLVGRMPWGSPGDGRCVWATMSREPIHRLVSAYMWCKTGEEGNHFDALCGGRSQNLGHGLNAANASIQQFAKHWGNFLMRELMWHPDLYEIAKSRPDFRSDDLDCFADPWVQFKIQLNGGDNIRTRSGKANLAEVEKRLRAEHGQPPLYDVYGIVERWSETMSMFDTFMPLEWGDTWLDQTTKHGGIDHGSASYKDEENRVLEEAEQDAEVHEFLAGDLYLYHKVILPMFDRKVRELSQ